MARLNSDPIHDAVMDWIEASWPGLPSHCGSYSVRRDGGGPTTITLDLFYHSPEVIVEMRRAATAQEEKE